MLKVHDIVEAVRFVVGPGTVGFSEPSIGEAEAESVAATVRAGAVGYEAVDRFQAKIVEICGTEQGTAVSSGTAALHLALMAAGVKAGDEVLMPALTFVATANAASYLGAIPHFVDSRDYDFGINPFKLRQYLGRILETKDGVVLNRRTGRPITAMVVVHLLGHPAVVDELAAIAGHYGLQVVEDAAEALGSLYKGRACGSYGISGAVSFNNNKIVTTNGGGAVLTNDPYHQAKVWTMATTARPAHFRRGVLELSGRLGIRDPT